MYQRYKPHILLAYEALFRRLKKRYRTNETLVSNYLRYKVGYQGECKVDYQLALFPNKDFYHLPGLRLKMNQYFFQIDSLIMTPKVIFILEIKNIKGTLEYSSHYGQLIQTNNGKEIGYQNPLTQANIQKNHLTNWLKQYNYDIPIEPFIISTNQHAVFRNIHNDHTYNHRFFSIDKLSDKLNAIYDSFSRKILTNKDIHFVTKKLEKYNTPLVSRLLEQHQIKQHHLLNGVPCYKCENPLKWQWGKFRCTFCQTTFNDVHNRAIYDYFLLHKPYITNEQCRQFLQLPNSNVT